MIYCPTLGVSSFELPVQLSYSNIICGGPTLIWRMAKYKASCSIFQDTVQGFIPLLPAAIGAIQPFQVGRGCWNTGTID